MNASNLPGIPSLNLIRTLSKIFTYYKKCITTYNNNLNTNMTTEVPCHFNLIFNKCQVRSTLRIDLKRWVWPRGSRQNNPYNKIKLYLGWLVCFQTSPSGSKPPYSPCDCKPVRGCKDLAGTCNMNMNMNTFFFFFLIKVFFCLNCIWLFSSVCAENKPWSASLPRPDTHTQTHTVSALSVSLWASAPSYWLNKEEMFEVPSQLRGGNAQ